MFKGFAKSLIVISFVVLFAVNAFAGPKAGGQTGGAAGHLTGNTLASMYVGVTEAPVGWREVVNAGGSQSYVSNYPKLQQPKQPTAAQQLAKAKADLAKAKRDLAKAKKTQP